MLAITISLWLWVGFLLGFVSLTMSQSVEQSESQFSTQIDPDLFTKAWTHAQTMTIENKQQHQFLEQLQTGDIEALYTVAQSLNKRGAGDDRITSVQIWHALADGPAAHIPSAVALGFSYADVDKQRALKYFIQASNGKEETGPHQAALFNAGRLFLELNDAASSLAHIRACANLHQQFPSYASSQITSTCQEAYQTLSLQIQNESTYPPGMEDAAEMFLYASIDEFPSPNTKEFTIWSRAMEHLEKYAALIRDGSYQGEVSARKKGQVYLMAAQQELNNLISTCGNKMSELQRYLIDIILGRVQVFLTGIDIHLDEL